MKRSNYVACVAGLAFVLVSCGIFINKKTERCAPQVKEASAPMFASTPVYASPFADRSMRAKSFALQNGYSTNYCFFIDMSIASGKKRFFVYDLNKNVVLISGLVAHGSCKEGFLTDVKFSNEPGSGCSSLGRYKIGEKYRGQYGVSYKLYGLDNTNSNAYRRSVVLHGISSIPDQEIYPKPICNSFGCPMVSADFFTRLSYIIDRSNKPIILWIY